MVYPLDLPSTFSSECLQGKALMPSIRAFFIYESTKRGEAPLGNEFLVPRLMKWSQVRGWVSKK